MTEELRGTFTGTFNGTFVPSGACGKKVITPNDIQEEGSYRLEMILGDGGTGDLISLGGPPAFWKKSNGKVGMVFLGTYWSGFPTGHSLYEYEIDPNIPPHMDMNLAPYLKFKHDWGDIRNGHIMVAAGQNNYYSGEMTYKKIDNKTGILYWMTNEGYAPTIAWPEMSATVLHHDTGLWESYGPWRIDKHTNGHHRFATSVLQLSPQFVEKYCPGYSLGVMGQMGSGVPNSPFGYSLMAIRDIDPTTLAPATACGQPANIDSKVILFNDLDKRAERDDLYAICGWSQAYNCSQGSPRTRGTKVWGGGDPSVGENDAVSWGVMIDNAKVHGLVLGGALLRTPSGYEAPGDPEGLVHGFYGDPLHCWNAVNPSPSPPFKNKHCCHGQASPWWGATGPACHFRQPMLWMFDPSKLATVKDLGGNSDPWTLQPTNPLGHEFKSVSPSADILPPQDADDWRGVYNFGGAAWYDDETGKLYVPANRDGTTGNWKINVFVYNVTH